MQAKSTTLNDIILSAAKGKEPDGFCDLSDLHLHTILHQLYAEFEAGTVSKEDAAKKKAAAVNAWKEDKEALQRYENTVKEWTEKIRLADQTGVQLHKAKTLREFAEGAATILESVIGEAGLHELIGKLK